jgi:hypothetical protein
MQDRALEIVKRVLVSHEEAPLDDMERLIALSAGDDVLTQQLLEGAVEVLSADPASLVPCWLALIAGELGPVSASVLLSNLGTSEGEALDATILSVLTRHVGPFYEAIKAAIQEAAPEEHEVRAILYSALLAVAVGRDDAMRDDLRGFAARCEQVEAAMPGPLGIPAAPAYLTAAISATSESLDGEPAGPLASTRQLLQEDWRAAARRITALFGVNDAARR